MEAGSNQVQASFFPQGPLRVLVVEGDDSTRQVISALLRKCNYRVASASDGMEGWKLLKEKPHSIDLVLAEVEVPSVSGLDLLTLIMDDESCKNIPVIMMSSQDSMSIVYKCMLKGAADFLVKPIRRNELRNLWQHVWRRHSLTDSHSGNQDGNLAKRKHEDILSGKEKNSSGYVHPTKTNKECSEKGSDAESSCTRSDMDAESTYKRTGHSGGEQIQLNGSSQQLHEWFIAAGEAKPFVGKCVSNELLLATQSADNHNLVGVAPIKEAINLIGVMESQPDNDVRSISGDHREKLYDKDAGCRPSSMPLLELSLRRYQSSSFEGGRGGECSKLNHSGSSPFQLYNSKNAVPTKLTPTTSPADRDDQRHGSSSSSAMRWWHGAASAPDTDAGNAAASYGVGFPTRNGKAIHEDSSGHQPTLKHANADQLQDEQVHTRSGGGNFCGTDNGTGSCEAPGEAAAAANGVLRKLTDASRSSQREAALSKFRMKRKDRCFEKKVRYQSRKKLAEQRPRVKGQFVRHVQPGPPPTEV